MNESKKISKVSLFITLLLSILLISYSYHLKFMFDILGLSFEIKILIIASIFLYAVIMNIAKNFKKNPDRTKTIENLQFIIVLISVMAIAPYENPEIRLAGNIAFCAVVATMIPKFFRQAFLLKENETKDKIK